ncbi:MAG: amidohydrolase [Firmicutes bacterium]|nr:amidohydrolase [Bacillota bacterium]
MYHGLKVLDVHGHVSVPPGSSHRLALLLGSNTALPSPLSMGQSVPGVSEEEFRQAAARHVAYLDARNIDVQLIGPRPFMMLGWMQPHLLPAWTRYVNDTIAQQCRFYPDRFVGACQLPQNSEAKDLSHCLPELERCVRELGFVAAYVSPDPGGRRTTPGMHEPYWYPLYEACEDMDIPIIVHGTNSLDPRFAVVPHNYQLGFVTEQYLAGQFISHGDVFERFPRLRVIICHAGGALNRFIPSDPHLAQKDLSRNLFYDSCAYDLHFLEAAIKQRGVSQMLFGTEAPGSGQAIRPETGRTSDDLVPVIAELPFLSEADRQAIFYHNPLRVVPGFAKALGPQP